MPGCPGIATLKLRPDGNVQKGDGLNVRDPE